MEDVKSCIKKLNGENYQIWKYKLELLLMKEDLWDTISCDKPDNAPASWISKDGKARATIGLLVEDSQLVHLQGNVAKEVMPNAVKIWTRYGKSYF